MTNEAFCLSTPSALNSIIESILQKNKGHCEHSQWPLFLIQFLLIPIKEIAKSNHRQICTHGVRYRRTWYSS